MKKEISIKPFQFTGKGKFRIQDAKTKIGDFYEDKAEYEALMTSFRTEIDALQSMMYAHNRYGLLVVFQAMDAAGKDSAIKAVFSGVNPHGVKVSAFKKPSETELDHDFLWRTTLTLPERGIISIFNRSYYEEVLVVKVHPEILTKYQKVPTEFTQNLDKVWEERYEDIATNEKYLHRNGMSIVKIFLHISQKEQAARFLERIEDETKNWKFAEADLEERKHWKAYMNAYEDAINATATEDSPWYIVPADDKKNARLIISQIILEHLKKLKINYPVIDEARQATLQGFVTQLKKEME
ncbi:MAG: polyphosphate kinase 2 family protein [Bacteroidia bacterium]